MAKFGAPSSMDFTNPNGWSEWITRFARYRMATKLHKDDEEVQVNALIYSMGPEAEHIFKSFKFDDGEATKYAPVLKKFNEYFKPRTNIAHERGTFNCLKQEEGIELFLRSLYEQADKCEYGDIKDDMIRDRLLVGMKDRVLAHELQRGRRLTLEEYVAEIRQSELVKGNIAIQSTWSAGSSHAVLDEVSHGRGGRGRSKGRIGRGGYRGNRGGSHSRPPSSLPRSKCGKCGTAHDNGDRCPAYNASCFRCHQHGHFARRCPKSSSKSVHEVTENNPDSYFLGTVTDVSKEEDNTPWEIALKVCGSTINFKIDCGADVTIISEREYNNLSRQPDVRVATVPLRGVGTRIKCVGMFTAKIKYGDEQYVMDIYVVPNTDSNLLSRSASRAMGLIELKIEEVEEDIFGDMGTLEGDPVMIRLKEDARPYHVNTARRIPIPLIPKVEEELKRMENAGVIMKVTEPTDWCSPLVVTLKKTGAVRLCIDLRMLNKAVMRERYTIPTLQDVATKLAGGQVFSSLDAASGYYHIRLHSDSMKYTTFMTPSGRYCFKRLPFGITSASEIFQRKMADILGDIPGVAIYQDDMLIGECIQGGQASRDRCTSSYVL